MAGRADPLGEGLDLAGFKPRKPEAKIPASEIRKVAEGASFPSREAVPIAESGPLASERAMRRVYRTGRNAQFSCKAEPDIVDRFYSICNRENWVMGETLRRAVEALEREMDSDG